MRTIIYLALPLLISTAIFPNLKITLTENANTNPLTFDIVIEGVSEMKNFTVEGLPSGVICMDNKIIVNKDAQPGSYMIKFIITDANQKKYNKVLFFTLSADQLNNLERQKVSQQSSFDIQDKNSQQKDLQFSSQGNLSNYSPSQDTLINQQVKSTNNQQIWGSELSLSEVIAPQIKKQPQQTISNGKANTTNSKKITFSKVLPNLQTQSNNRLIQQSVAKVSENESTFATSLPINTLNLNDIQQSVQNSIKYTENQNKLRNSMLTALNTYNQLLDKQKEISDNSRQIQNNSSILEKAILQNSDKINRIKKEIESSDHVIKFYQFNVNSLKSKKIILVNDKKIVMSLFLDQEMKISYIEDQILQQVSKCQQAIEGIQKKRNLDQIKQQITRAQKREESIKFLISQKERQIQSLEKELQKLKKEKMIANSQLKNQIRLEQQYSKILSQIEQESSEPQITNCKQAITELNLNLQSQKQQLKDSTSKLTQIQANLKQNENWSTNNEKQKKNIEKQNQLKSSQINELLAISLLQNQQKSALNQKKLSNEQQMRINLIEVSEAKKIFEDYLTQYENFQNELIYDE